MIISLSGTRFFPQLGVAGPFHDGLAVVFTVAAGMALVSALASKRRESRAGQLWNWFAGTGRP